MPVVAIGLTGREREEVPLRSWPLALFFAVLTSCASLREERAATERVWATDVLLGAESGARRRGVVRWRAPVVFLVVDAGARLRAAVDGAFGQLQQALAGVHELTLEHVGSSDVRIGRPGFVTVFGVAPAAADELAKLHRAMPPGLGADGWFTISWNGAFELTRALVFIDPALELRWLRHTALEELFQALGPSNDSDLVRDSLLYERVGDYGSHDRLARVDLQVLRMLYRDLEPGADRAAIARAMARCWRFAGG
ncbi:MAG: DUF2927 domain-containing protein [Planctomycetota bacterium]